MNLKITPLSLKTFMIIFYNFKFNKVSHTVKENKWIIYLV